MYILDEQSEQLRLSSLENNQQQVIINIDNLQFFGCGLDHVLFSRMDKPGQLVIFKRSRLGKKQNKGLDAEGRAIIEKIYQQLLDQLFLSLKKYRCFRKPMRIFSKVSSHTYEGLEYKVRNRSSQARIPDEQFFGIDRQNQIVYLAFSVFENSEYNTIIEFKPKTIMPDRYTLGTLQEISHQFGIDLFHIKELLKVAQPIQKLRWYKKEKLGNSGKEINMNPLQTFRVDDKNTSPPQFTATKCFKKIPSLTPEQTDLLNRSILEEIHRDKELLQTVFTLQGLFLNSPEHIQINQPIDLIEEEKLKMEMVSAINSSPFVKKEVDFRSLGISLLQESCLSQQIPQWSSLCATLMFLISLTWKDVSFVYLAHFDGEAFLSPKIKVIDDYLKGVEKIRSNIKKDKQLLTKYIEHKLLQQVK